MSAPSLPSLLVSHWTFSASVAVPAARHRRASTCSASGAPAVGGRRAGPTAFLAGIGAVLVALQSGLDTYDDRMLSDHMVQHLLLLVGGAAAPARRTSGASWRCARCAPSRRRGLARALDRTRPFTGPARVAWPIHRGGPAHPPAVVLRRDAAPSGAARRRARGCTSAPACSCSRRCSTATRLPGTGWSGLGKLVYLIVAMMPMALIGAYLNRHATLVYPAYGPPARTLGISALDDQAQAGAIMWVVGGSIMVAVGLWAAVAAMVAEERRQVARDARADASLARRRGIRAA